MEKLGTKRWEARRWRTTSAPSKRSTTNSPQV